MIVFAAWGPDPTSADPVTGTVEPFHPESDIKTARTINLHHEHGLHDEKQGAYCRNSSITVAFV